MPDGSAFDTEVYTALAAMFPDGKLPDLRECSLVMVGRSGRPEITNHDEYTAGQFKNDQFAEHNHTLTDPGHTHDVTDPGHDHGRGTQEITGSFGGISNDDNRCKPTGAFTLGNNENGAGSGENDTRVNFNASRTWTGRSSEEPTGVSVDSNTTGISIAAAGAADMVTHGKQVGVYYYIAF